MRSVFRFAAILATIALVILAVPPEWLPQGTARDLYHTWFGEAAWQDAPRGSSTTPAPEPRCPDARPERRNRQTIEGVDVEESRLCEPDDPFLVAAAVRGTNHVSRETLLASGLAPDAIVKSDDRDGDGDPDHIVLRLEVIELNGRSPDIAEVIPQWAIAPGIRPGFWVFAPKTTGMSTRSLEDLRAHPLLRVPSPTIRVEQGDTLEVVLENTHYFPHTIHFHGVDHPFLDARGEGNDGVPHASEHAILPGERRVYEMTPRQPGTMFYHCHVQPHVHILMGLQGMFVVEPNRPANPVQTLNPGAGHVRYRSAAVRERYDREYDLVYLDLDRELHEIIQSANDPGLIARSMNQRYDITERTADYFLLNGRSFPYTFREGLVIVKPDERIKLRVLNGGLEGVSLHTHGHKVTITHTDGVEVPAPARIMRDVAWLSSAQRLDLELRTTNDGLHAYGEGIWMLHDHREAAVTTDGIHPGGDLSSIVYESFLGEDDWPETRGHGFELFFDPRFYRGEIGVWDDLPGFAPPRARDPATRRVVIVGLLAGLALGLLGAAVRARGTRRSERAR